MVQYVCIYRCLSHGLIDSKLCVFVIIKKLCPAGEEVRDLCPGREGKKTTMRAGTRLFLSSPSSGPDGQGRPKWHFGGLSVDWARWTRQPQVALWRPIFASVPSGQCLLQYQQGQLFSALVVGDIVRFGFFLVGSGVGPTSQEKKKACLFSSCQPTIDAQRNKNKARLV
jgi:hypothetical protein